MIYEQELTDAVEAVKREGRYRVFADVKRRRGAFPKADVLKDNAANAITVWCSNDYLGMGQHPKVLAAMHEAIDLLQDIPETFKGVAAVNIERGYVNVIERSTHAAFKTRAKDFL